ncbi:hypothetical protein PAMP_019314 [Pampus punctatissimus]
MGETEDERTAQTSQLFENFVQSSTCKGTLQAFSILCRQLELDPLDYSNFYSSLKAAVSSWKVKALWTKLDKRAQHKVYSQNKACQGTRCLIIGGGPCGLRTAIELALLGCKVVVIEKRDTFSRNNVLHLWPFTIHDLRALGAKKFYGKFCAGSIDHISPGWRAEVRPSSHSVSDFDFDVVIGADGRKNTLDGFGRKEFRGKLAIAITANFVNRNTTAEAKVEEISGVAFIFNQKFFLELREETGIDLENIVYYKDNTHYFVMTAKKQSLLDKGVIINDYIETERLLNIDNVNQEALLSYAREAADFGTNYQLPSLDYAINHYGQPDVAMFDFTSMYASENAALIREKHGHQLLVALVGDSLLEVRVYSARSPSGPWVQVVLGDFWQPSTQLGWESIYRLLPQTTTENISKNFEQYAIDPATRYPNLNSSCVRPHQVRHLFIDGQQDSYHRERGGPTGRSVNVSRRESDVRPGRLLTWCQKQTQGYRGVDITNLTSSWRNGLALCALIHRHRPELIDYDSLNEEDVAGNNQLAFDVAEQQLGIQPVTTGKEMAAEAEPDKLLMVLYLSKFYEAFRNSPVNNNGSREPDENSEEYSTKTNHTLLNPPQPRKRIPRDDKKLEDDSVKRPRKGNHYLTELSCHSAPPAGEDGELRENKVRSMATQLLAKFEENSSTGKMRSKPKDAPPPPSPPRSPSRPKWQPSIYLRLLENPTSVAQQTSFLYSPKPSDAQSSYSRSPSPSSCKSPLRSSSPELTERHYPERTSFDLTASHFSAPALSRIDRPSVRLEEEMQQVELSASVPPSLSPSPPPPSSVSKSSTIYPMVHPVPDPTAQAGFSSVPLYTAGHKNKKHSPTPSSYTDSDKPEEIVLHVDSSSCNKTSIRLPSSCSDESQEIASLLSESNCENGHSSSDYISRDNQVRKTAHETFDDNKCDENGHAKRTVGKVSSTIDARAQKLAILYETDHRPNATPCVVRKDFPPGLGGSDTCHFCSKRVYVMERLSTEGYFFHRECFRCDVCNCTLRLGGHTFDSQEAKFYCKMHYAQRQSSTHLGRFRRRKDDQSHVTPSSLDSGSYSATGSVQIEPPGGSSSLHSEQLDKCQTSVPEDTEMAVEPLDASCIGKPAAQDGTEDSTKDHCNAKQNNRWKKKIRATFPLIFIKHFQRSWPRDKEGPETVPEADSDFEEITSAEKQTVQAETETDKPQTDSGQDGEPPQSQTSAPSPSAFQLIANAFRKTFSVTNRSSSSNTAVTMRTERDGTRKQRPMSEGAFNFSSFFSTTATEPSIEEAEKKAGKREARWASVGADPWGAGRDLPSLLQQVSLKSRRDSGGVFSDDMPSMSHRRRVNLFSSLRLRKREASESEGKDQEVQKEIRTILTNLRNKASSQQNFNEPCSTDDENENTLSNPKLHSERQKRMQEKTVAQQAKREQLKRLHRAQAIQRQLEEVGEKQKDLEERGVAIEKIIRGETEESQTDEDEEAQLYQSWFKLVLEKNRLARYESELMIFAQELELEDTQSRLQQDLRRRMAIEDTMKSASELQEEQEILAEIMRTVEKRDMLVSILEEQRLKERAEDRDLESLVLSKGYEIHWAQADDSWGQEKLEQKLNVERLSDEEQHG